MAEDQSKQEKFTPPDSMDQIPQDRIFCTAVLFLTPENQVAGGLDYKGTILKDVSTATGMECKLAAEHLERYLRQAIDHAAVEVHALGGLMAIFGIREEDLEQDDSDNSSSGEQASSATS